MRYIGWLEEAFLIYKCPISSITGKRLLLQNNKYYASDTGVRNVECGKENTNRGSLLENIVLFELLRKNFRVVTGKLKDGKEINFVASKEGWEIYIQVTEKIDWDIESKNYKRDIGNLRSVRNNFPKVVISLYDESGVLMNGVMVINIVEWTLGENKYVVI
jgi:predicted AAA+ superfamily ATPase